MNKQTDKITKQAESRLALLSRNRNEDCFVKGDQVQHPIYGKGVITASRFENAKQKAVCIQFDEFGFRWIIAKTAYLTLTKQGASTRADKE